MAARAVGSRKQGNPARLTRHDQFHLGSLTKAMTATLLAIVLDDESNNLTWRTTLPEAFPDIANMSAEHASTTLEMLAAHYSGVNDAILAAGVGLELGLAIRNQSLSPTAGRKAVTEVALTAPPSLPAGSTWQYSNIGYMMLGHLIDIHSAQYGGSWETAIRSRMWAPLGMTTCGFGTPPERTLE